ncbi:hypothetical protein N657DRAFT_118001 [Parathielavia appendiculata]|uniref:Uncharacterized protein n=1 Tax=Parathielavia appendiculata TaxID=2587402 RepID=A0AAN6TX73_9PEZI|nr:hypothetical protein N657DRAFT_118001 [Parathielavia appendiculata]
MRSTFQMHEKSNIVRWGWGLKKRLAAVTATGPGMRPVDPGSHRHVPDRLYSAIVATLEHCINAQMGSWKCAKPSNAGIWPPSMTQALDLRVSQQATKVEGAWQQRGEQPRVMGGWFLICPTNGL